MRDRDRAIPRRQSPSFGARIASMLLMVWLATGLLAAAQRDYFQVGPIDCAGFGTIVLTAVAGPLNYVGVNPKVAECDVPEPSR